MQVIHHRAAIGNLDFGQVECGEIPLSPAGGEKARDLAGGIGKAGYSIHGPQSCRIAQAISISLRFPARTVPFAQQKREPLPTAPFCLACALRQLQRVSFRRPAAAFA
jgi:hypothetical protein